MKHLNRSYGVVVTLLLLTGLCAAKEDVANNVIKVDRNGNRSAKKLVNLEETSGTGLRTAPKENSRFLASGSDSAGDMFHDDNDGHDENNVSNVNEESHMNQSAASEVTRDASNSGHSNESGVSDGEHHDDNHVGTHVTYDDIYHALIFILVVYIMGQLATFIGMPALVGEIVTGFLLGPPLANYVPFPAAFVLFGEIGLIALLLEAGIDIDIAQLKVTGARSFAMAVVGSLLPLAVGIGIGMGRGLDIRGAIAIGATFSPTSLGVASNALSTGKVLNTPVGQLIIAACVVDDVIGLVLLSMLEVVAKEGAQVYEYFIPLISAFGYLIVLGYIAIAWMPKIIEEKILARFSEKYQNHVAFFLMLLLVVGYMPLLYYSKASYLTGAFLAGLSFSQIHSIHHTFLHQTKKIMAWLLRIFFAASIGFQVPVRLFADPSIIAWGFAFYVAVLAKFPLGLFVPKFHENTPHSFPFNPYIRDVLTAGLAMTCRGEFSFIIASTAVNSHLFDINYYASLVFAVLLSCVTSPFALLFSIRYYNKLSAEFLRQTSALFSGSTIEDKIPLFLVVQARTGIKWGLQDIMHRRLDELGLVVIDHRSWQPRGLDATVVTEIYVQDNRIMISGFKSGNDSTADDGGDNLDSAETGASGGKKDEENSVVAERCAEIQKEIVQIIDQPTARVQVTQWIPKLGSNFASSLTEGDVDLTNSEVAKQAAAELSNKKLIDTQLDLDNPTKRDRTKSSKPTVNASVLKDVARGDDSVDEDGLADLTSGDVLGLRHRGMRGKLVSTPALKAPDLWSKDKISMQAAISPAIDKRRGSIIMDTTYDYDAGIAYGQASHMKVKAPRRSMIDIMPTVEERLGGLVRYDLVDSQQNTSGRKIGTKVDKRGSFA